MPFSERERPGHRLTSRFVHQPDSYNCTQDELIRVSLKYCPQTIKKKKRFCWAPPRMNQIPQMITQERKASSEVHAPFFSALAGLSNKSAPLAGVLRRKVLCSIRAFVPLQFPYMQTVSREAPVFTSSTKKSKFTLAHKDG